MNQWRNNNDEDFVIARITSSREMSYIRVFSLGVFCGHAMVAFEIGLMILGALLYAISRL